MFDLKQGLFSIAILASAVFSAPAALAQAMNSDDIIRQVVPSQAGPTVTNLKSNNALVIPPDQPIPAVFDYPKAFVAVSFYDDSHLLTADGMLTLRSMAEALLDPRLSAETFQVGGYVVETNDPVGAARLSSKRAQTVVEHLTTFYSIAPERVTPVGYGVPSASNPISGGVGNTHIQLTNLLFN
ncbi:MAG: OmpA family protein [Pseudomonadota bacterium]